METKFTKGLWKAVIQNIQCDGFVEKKVRIVGGSSFPGLIATIDMAGDKTLANAQLIAVAPELYAALDAIVHVDPGNNHSAKFYRNALTVLAKARGEK